MPAEQSRVPPSALTTAPSGAVFVSYASQDGAVARQIATALRAAGIEVWFDQSELRGGEAWDRQIRQQIRDCRLFVALISAHTEARDEGYFRREWKLAVERTHDMAEHKPFLVPVVIDATPERGAAVPDKFREVQWTHLPGGASSPAFIEQIRRLLKADAAAPLARSDSSAPWARTSGRATPRQKYALWVTGAALAGASAFLLVGRFWSPPRAPMAAAAPTAAVVAVSPAVTTAPAFAPPPHSIAVLPFVNMSGDPGQEYFSDGLTEELLDSLSRINELQVAARTSAFAFKGQQTDVGTIARKLNVGAVLEGSVRRSAHTVRVTAQLINAVTGFHLWSQTFDRNLGDVLKLQTEIATAVAGALRVTLLEGTDARIELGGTANPAAFDAFLRGRTLARTADSDAELHAAQAAYTEAVRLDPHFASAFTERSLEFIDYADFNAHGAEVNDYFDKGLADARTAVRLAPDLGLAHYMLGLVLQIGFRQLREAAEEFERALTLAPGNARVVAGYSRYAAQFQRTEATLQAGRRALALDPLNFHVHRTVGIAFLLVRHYAEAAAMFQTAITLRPDYLRNHTLLGQARYELGDLPGALAACQVAAATDGGKACLAKTYQKLGRRSDAEAALQALKASEGDEGAYDYATVYAQWGDIPKALDWLEKAARDRPASLYELKAEPDLDPLRGEPRFQAIEKALGFPD
jgi:TolB-like protein/Tfp pilus assembly protein PilF